MKITRVFTGADGQSHFDVVEVDIDPGNRWTNTSGISAEPLYFRSYAPPGADSDFVHHPAHAKQFMVMISGEKEIEVGHGIRQRFSLGEVLFMDDTTGAGHITRTLSDDRTQLCIPVADDFDFQSWVSENNGRSVS